MPVMGIATSPVAPQAASPTSAPFEPTLDWTPRARQLDMRGKLASGGDPRISALAGNQLPASLMILRGVPGNSESTFARLARS
jgi:hypothetical protein